MLTLILAAALQITPAVEPAFETPSCSEETADSPVVLATADKAFAVSQIWSLAHHHFPYFDQVPDLDWDAAYHQALSDVIATENCFEYSLVLQRFVALLQDGHTGVWGPNTGQVHIDYVPLRLRDIDGRPMVFGAFPEVLETAPLGSEILSIDGRSVDDIITEDIEPYVAQSTPHVRRMLAVRGRYGQGWGLLAGEPGSMAELEFRTPEGDIVSLSLRRDRWSGGHDFSSFEMFDVPTASGECEYRWVEDGIAYINLPTFGDPSPADAFEAIVDELRPARTVIIDLRTNGGGNTSHGARVLGHFADRELPGSVWRTRETHSANVAWGAAYYRNGAEFLVEHANAFTGERWYTGEHGSIPASDTPLSAQLIILTSHYTASAAEDFLIFADSLPSATVIGQPSFGSTGEPLMFDLPGGLGGRIVTKRDTFPNGRDFVGFGVRPDIAVDPTLAGVLAQEDEILARAVEYARTGR